MRALQEYERKRNFRKTPEPAAQVPKRKSKEPIFVVQEHHASHLHYDFRLEVDGVLKSWAVPKGPSLDPSLKRLAVQVEDHPLSYAKFEGHIPEPEYGAGDVYIWDQGTWQAEGDPAESLRKGKIEFTLKGKKLKGRWLLFRTRTDKGKAQWILRKRTDDFALAGAGDQDISTAQSAVRSAKPSPAKAKSPARKEKISPLPDFLDLELALLVEEPPKGEGWIHETKYDGYRTQARVDQGVVQLLTRTAQDWTKKFPTVARALQKLKVQNAIFDGEIVWIDEKGRSDFQSLQNALKHKESSSLIYYVFDLLYLNGEDLREISLLERKKILEDLLAPLAGTAVLFSDHLRGEAEEFLEAACDLQLEGIVSKKADSPYMAGRSDNWVKSKCKQRQEFVIGGYTEGEGARKGFGALLLGVYENEKLRYVGRVGTGFNSDSLLALRERLEKVEQSKNPFALGSVKGGREIHWVKPVLVAEVAFSNWTEEGILRVPVFQGLREDKPANQIRREKAARAPSETKPSRQATLQKPLTNPDKILYADEGITKLEVLDYYEKVSKWMLPLVADRPLTLVRCPEGTSGSCFYQKHSPKKLPESIHAVCIKEKTATRDYMTIDSMTGVQELVQMGALELHLWNCLKNDVKHPDQVVLDLDPGPGIEWKQLVQAARDMKSILDDLNLQSFVKVTGSKGIHLHVPVSPVYSWDQIKEFALTLAQELVSRKPELYTTTLSKKARGQKIFIDYLRNALSATAVAPYSLRARPQSAVALPVEWEELSKLKSSADFDLKRALKKIRSRTRDPWAGFQESAQEIAILKRGKP